MSSSRGSKYPACSITIDGGSSFSFSRASTPFEVSRACLKHLVGRLFPDKAGTFAAPAGHEADLETVYRALEAGRSATGDAKGPVVVLHIYRGDLEGVRPVELTGAFDLKTYLDDIRHHRQDEATRHTAKLQRTGTRKAYQCSWTARLTNKPGAADA